MTIDVDALQALEGDEPEAAGLNVAGRCLWSCGWTGEQE
jgi:hypothetical protein